MSARHLCIAAGMTLGLSPVAYAASPSMGALLLVLGVLGAVAGLLWPTGLRRVSLAVLQEAHRWALRLHDDDGAEALRAEQERRLREVGHG